MCCLFGFEGQQGCLAWARSALLCRQAITSFLTAFLGHWTQYRLFLQTTSEVYGPGPSDLVNSHDPQMRTKTDPVCLSLGRSTPNFSFHRRDVPLFNCIPLYLNSAYPEVLMGMRAGDCVMGVVIVM